MGLVWRHDGLANPIAGHDFHAFCESLLHAVMNGTTPLPITRADKGAYLLLSHILRSGTHLRSAVCGSNSAWPTAEAFR